MTVLHSPETTSTRAVLRRFVPFTRQRMWVAMRWREIRGYISYALGKPDPKAKHVLIFAQGRSGTTLLESLLCSTGHFTGMGEPLHLYTREVWAPIRYIRGLGRAAKGRSLIVHVKGSQLVRARKRPVEPATFLSALVRDGWTIVYVCRLCVADQVLSECLAKTRGAYHKTDDRQETTKVRIEPDEFIERYERRLRYHEQDNRSLEDIEHLKFIYENDLRDAKQHQETVNVILEALSLATRQVQTKLRRISSSDPRQKLENYQEISTVLAERGLDWGTLANVPSSPSGNEFESTLS